MKLAFFAALFIILLIPTQVLAQQTPAPAIDIGQSKWGKPTLNVLILLNESESWWQSYFPEMTTRAVQQWNDAFAYFANQYPSYGYLANLQITTTTSNVTLPDYDVYVIFDPNVLIQGIDALGTTLVESYLNKTIKYATITLSAQSQALDLTQQIYRDTTTHELGHALGLGHSNYTNDLMYPYQDIIASNYSISTLDLYGVALLFRWMNQTNFTKNVVLSTPSSTILPDGVTYSYAPVNNPAPVTLNDNPIVRFLMALLLNPIVLVLMVVMFSMFILLSFTVVRRKRRRAQVRRGYGVSSR
jgi:hypothetical protein